MTFPAAAGQGTGLAPAYDRVQFQSLLEAKLEERDFLVGATGVTDEFLEMGMRGWRGHCRRDLAGQQGRHDQIPTDAPHVAARRDVAGGLIDRWHPDPVVPAAWDGSRAS